MYTLFHGFLAMLYFNYKNFKLILGYNVTFVFLVNSFANKNYTYASLQQKTTPGFRRFFEKNFVRQIPINTVSTQMQEQQ